jgi:alpha-tubulin suppressor-like RCC1 family protein
VGYRSLFALSASGSARVWGYNESGQLGTGTTDDQWTPVKIADPP